MGSKNNEKTIFGLASNFDENNETRTEFKTNKLVFKRASDVGNFHAGFTGSFTYGESGIPPTIQSIGAGLVETLKDTSRLNLHDLQEQIGNSSHPPGGQPGPSYGDEFDDYIYNNMGMQRAEQEKSD